MLWVGGNIVVHALHEMGWHLPYDLIHGAAVTVGQGAGFVEWVVTALLDGVVGIALGYVLLPVVERVSALFGKGEGAEAH
jgi:predicted DNA repair protein MutK